MNPAPLPQPAPFTCPHCGAGMDSQQEYCPRCGERLSAVPRSGMSPFMMVGLGSGLIIFGGIGACGGLFTVSALQQGPYTGVVLFFSLPSLLVGLVGFIACLRPFLKRK